LERSIAASMRRQAALAKILQLLTLFAGETAGCPS
jgi:hypothetical protein